MTRFVISTLMLSQLPNMRIVLHAILLRKVRTRYPELFDGAAAAEAIRLTLQEEELHAS